MRSVQDMLRGLAGSLKGSLNGGTRIETAEKWSIAIITAGALMLAAGIFLSAWQTQGIAALLSMSGAFVSFLATVTLIFVWLIKDIKSQPEGSGQ